MTLHSKELVATGEVCNAVCPWMAEDVQGLWQACVGSHWWVWPLAIDLPMELEEGPQFKQPILLLPNTAFFSILHPSSPSSITLTVDMEYCSISILSEGCVDIKGLLFHCVQVQHGCWGQEVEGDFPTHPPSLYTPGLTALVSVTHP